MFKNSKIIALLLAIYFIFVLAGVAQKSTEKIFICPMDGKIIEISAAKAKFEYKGMIYYFCCEACKKKFIKNPINYAQKKSPTEEVYASPKYLELESDRSDIIEEIKRNLNWNLWRKFYDELTFKERKEIIEYWGLNIKAQLSSNANFFKKAFKKLGDLGVDISEKRVVELGSGNGELAYLCLMEFKVKSWTGYDISKNRVQNTLREAKELGFKNIELHKQLWDTSIGDFDIFVSGHTIEHISNKECIKLLEFVCDNAEAIIVEIPTSKDWHNYNGAHVMTLSKEEISQFIIDQGFRQIIIEETTDATNLLYGLYIKKMTTSTLEQSSPQIYSWR